MDAPTEINLVVRHKGQFYTRRHAIYYTGNTPTPSPGHELREIEYQVARALWHVKKEIDYHERVSRVTNPFAWS